MDLTERFRGALDSEGRDQRGDPDLLRGGAHRTLTRRLHVREL